MLPPFKTPLRRGNRLAEGGEGIVHEVIDHPDLLLKVYKSALTDQKRARIERLIAAASPKLLQHVAWPLRLLKDGQEDMMVMRYLRDAKPVHQLYDTGDRRKLFPGADWRVLVMMAQEAASACAEVHQAGFLVVDLSETNVLISGALELKLIDADAFVPQDDSVTATGTAFWSPPELTTLQPRTTDHDNFSLARLIFLLLFQGSDPVTRSAGQGGNLANEPQFAFSRRIPIRKPNPNELTLEELPAEVASMFEDAFMVRQQATGPRPTARAWEEALERMRSQLIICSQVESHSHLLSRPCPWCAMASIHPTYDPFRSDDAPGSTKPRKPPGPTPSAQSAQSAQPSGPISRQWRKAAGFAAGALVLLGAGWFFREHDSTPAPPVVAVPVRPPPVIPPQASELRVSRVTAAPLEPPQSEPLSTQERTALEARVKDLITQASIQHWRNDNLQLEPGSVGVECQRSDLCFGVVTARAADSHSVSDQSPPTWRYAVAPEHGALEILAEDGGHGSF